MISTRDLGDRGSGDEVRKNRKADSIAIMVSQLDDEGSDRVDHGGQNYNGDLCKSFKHSDLLIAIAMSLEDTVSAELSAAAD